MAVFQRKIRSTSAFYYLWYGENRHWNEGFIDIPKLGLYSSDDQKIVQNHINSAKKLGINNFIVSWWGIGSYEDQNLKTVLKPICEEANFDFCILYETPALHKAENNIISLEKYKSKLFKDFEYFCDHYFSSKSYFRLNNKPVVFLYLSRIIPDIELNILKEIRRFCKNKGFDIYIIGDEVYWNNPKEIKIERLKNFDALSLYNPHISSEKVLKDYWRNIIYLYDAWNIFCNENNLVFIPSVIPGFNDTKTRPEAKHPIIKRNKKKFFEQIKKLEKQNFGNIFICSWNEWHENTQIEDF